MTSTIGACSAVTLRLTIMQLVTEGLGLRVDIHPAEGLKERKERRRDG